MKTACKSPESAKNAPRKNDLRGFSRIFPRADGDLRGRRRKTQALDSGKRDELRETRVRFVLSHPFRIFFFEFFLPKAAERMGHGSL
jgi:hypothetical protein